MPGRAPGPPRGPAVPPPAPHTAAASRPAPAIFLQPSPGSGRASPGPVPASPGPAAAAQGHGGGAESCRYPPGRTGPPDRSAAPLPPRSPSGAASQPGSERRGRARGFPSKGARPPPAGAGREASPGQASLRRQPARPPPLTAAGSRCLSPPARGRPMSERGCRGDLARLPWLLGRNSAAFLAQLPPRRASAPPRGRGLSALLSGPRGRARCGRSCGAATRAALPRLGPWLRAGSGAGPRPPCPAARPPGAPHLPGFASPYPGQGTKLGVSDFVGHPASVGGVKPPLLLLCGGVRCLALQK